MLIKVCGLNNKENIQHVVDLKPDLIGFIFHKSSPRYFNNCLDMDEAYAIPKSIKKVGVFVNSDKYEILDKVAHYNLDYVQLHGNESIEFCKDLKAYIPVIKSISIKDQSSFLAITDYADSCDYVLLDTYTEQHGGSGKTFNWQWIQEQEGFSNVLLSGGISPQNFTETIPLKNMIKGIDVNSKFETEPGIKNINELKKLIHAIRTN